MTKNQIFFYILIRSWKAFTYFDKCVDSVFAQTYKKYKILFIDDASDYTENQKKYIKSKLKKHITVFNKQRMYSVYNGYILIHKYAKMKNSVVVFLDGDDWFINNNALKYINDIYRNKNILLTWGGCLVWNGKKYYKSLSRFGLKYSNKDYSNKIASSRCFRLVPFQVFHTMTFKTSLFKKIKQSDFKDASGNWLKYQFDLASFLPMLEMADNRYKVLNEPLYSYNVSTPNNISKLYRIECLKEEITIRTKKMYEEISI